MYQYLEVEKLKKSNFFKRWWRFNKINIYFKREKEQFLDTLEKSSWKMKSDIVRSHNILLRSAEWCKKQGKTCIRVMLKTDNYQYWNDLRKNNIKKYNQEKDRISKEVIKILDKRFGNIISNVDVVDVATLATFQLSLIHI